MHAIFSQPDTLTQIVQHCLSLKTLCKLSCLNRAFNTHTMHGCRHIWLDLASRITGYKASEHIDIKADDFHVRVKLLICPWLCIPQTLPVFPEPLMDPEEMHITLHDNASVVLWHKSENETRIVGMTNARPTHENSWSGVRNGMMIELPAQDRDDFFQLITPPARMQLTNQPECRFFYQRIHKRALAVIETNAWDMEHRNGIYFFQNKNGRTDKLLRHILTGCSSAHTSLIIRPMEMWMLTDENVLYFGPNNVMLPLTLAGRMDPALWLAGRGRANAAMHYLRKIGINDINAHGITGNMTLLHIATLQNKAAAVRTLLKAGADPEARDDQKMTCAMIASSVEYPDIIRVLCEEGTADPNATSYCEETALHIVGHQSTTNHDMTKATVLALLEGKANPNSEDINGQTPLFSFAILNAPSTVKLLCSRGADPTHRSHTDRTPLHTLFEVCLKVETAKVLVKRYKADVDAKDINGVTPLMLAAHTRSFINVRALLEDFNANPLLCDSKNRDALWYAKNGIDAPMQARAVIRVIEAKCIEWESLHD